MKFKKEFVVVFVVLLFLILISFKGNTERLIVEEIITGEASTVGIIENPLEDKEYLLYINQGQWIEGKFVKLLSVSESEDIEISVNENVASISDKIIINNDLQIKKSVAVKEDIYEKSFAVLEIIKVEQDKDVKCRDNDGGYNIYVKGKCVDEYYPKIGIEDFCDSNYLKEYSCKYDDYVEKVHCMKDIVECSECIEGRCINIKAY